MPGFWQTMLMALMPALGNLLGSGLAEWFKPARPYVGVALHGAAGVAMGVVAVELIPRALDQGVLWTLVAAFLAGAAASILLSKVVMWLKSGEDSGPWRVFLAVAIDVFIDGLMIGIGSAVAAALGLVLAISQVIGNIPGGFASTSNLRRVGMPLRRRVWPILLLPPPALFGAAAGYLLFRGAPPQTQAIALAFVAGLLLLATIEDAVPEGDEPAPPRKWSGAALAGGFALMLAFSGLTL